jgi:hypothetical protein
MAWIGDVVPEETISSTMWGNLVRDRVVHVFDSEAERNATAVPRQGMLSWSIAENRLALWMGADPGWVVIFEPWRAWSPTVWSGPTTNFTVVANNGSQYRHEGYMCEVFVSLTATLGATVPEDLIYISPPPGLPTTRPGPFGAAFIQDPTHGTIGTAGLCDATHLSIIQQGLGSTGLGSLIHRGDLATSGNIEIFMSGAYVISIS